MNVLKNSKNYTEIYQQPNIEITISEIFETLNSLDSNLCLGLIYNLMVYPIFYYVLANILFQFLYVNHLINL
jgi:hypothetical protein